MSAEYHERMSRKNCFRCKVLEADVDSGETDREGRVRIVFVREDLFGGHHATWIGFFVGVHEDKYRLCGFNINRCPQTVRYNHVPTDMFDIPTYSGTTPNKALQDFGNLDFDVKTIGQPTDELLRTIANNRSLMPTPKLLEGIFHYLMVFLTPEYTNMNDHANERSLLENYRPSRRSGHAAAEEEKEDVLSKIRCADPDIACVREAEAELLVAGRKSSGARKCRAVFVSYGLLDQGRRGQWVGYVMLDSELYTFDLNSLPRPTHGLLRITLGSASSSRKLPPCDLNVGPLGSPSIDLLNLLSGVLASIEDLETRPVPALSRRSSKQSKRSKPKSVRTVRPSHMRSHMTTLTIADAVDEYLRAVEGCRSATGDAYAERDCRDGRFNRLKKKFGDPLEVCGYIHMTS